MAGHKLALTCSKSKTFDSISHTPSRARSPGLPVNRIAKDAILIRRRRRRFYSINFRPARFFDGRDRPPIGKGLRPRQRPADGLPVGSDRPDRPGRGNPRSPSRRGWDTYAPDRVLWLPFTDRWLQTYRTHRASNPFPRCFGRSDPKQVKTRRRHPRESAWLRSATRPSSGPALVSVLVKESGRGATLACRTTRTVGRDGAGG